MKKLYYLFELDIAGTTYRMSSENLSVYSTEEARDILFKGVVKADFEWVDEIDFFKVGTASEPSAALEFFSEISIGKLISEGHLLEYSPAKIYLWTEGDTYEQAQLIVNGYTVEWEWDADDEPVTCTLVGKPIAGSGQQMPRQYQIISEDTHTFVNAAYRTSGTETKWYPLCFWGLQEAVFGPEKTEYLPMVEATVIRLAIGATTYEPTIALGGQLGTTGWNYYIDDGWIENAILGFGISVKENDKGELFTAFTDDTGATIEDEPTVWMYNPTGALKLGDDIIDNADLLTRYLVQESGAAVDLVRSKAALDLLKSYPIQFVIEEPVDVIEFLTDVIWQYTPICSKYGPNGLHLVRFDKNAVPTSSILVNNISVERLSTVKMGGLDNILNSFNIEGLYAIRKDEYQISLYRNGSPDNDKPNYACIQSEKAYGKRHIDLTCPAFKDKDTLNHVLDWMTDFYTQPYKRVAYSLPTSYSHLRAGDVVSITDDEIYISEQTCYVEEVAFRETSVDITVIYY